MWYSACDTLSDAEGINNLLPPGESSRSGLLPNHVSPALAPVGPYPIQAQLSSKPTKSLFIDSSSSRHTDDTDRRHSRLGSLRALDTYRRNYARGEFLCGPPPLPAGRVAYHLSPKSYRFTSCWSAYKSSRCCCSGSKGLSHSVRTIQQVEMTEREKTIGTR
jgi:hypothetical protein